MPGAIDRMTEEVDEVVRLWIEALLTSRKKGWNVDGRRALGGQRAMHQLEILFHIRRNSLRRQHVSGRAPVSIHSLPFLNIVRYRCSPVTL